MNKVDDKFYAELSRAVLDCAKEVRKKIIDDASRFFPDNKEGAFLFQHRVFGCLAQNFYGFIANTSREVEQKIIAEHKVNSR